ncbi:MAG: hypothetical protein ACLGIY_11380, partial [Betaproteobacteria bacterium]
MADAAVAVAAAAVAALATGAVAIGCAAARGLLALPAPVGAMQGVAAKKDAEIQQLKSQLEAGEVVRRLAVS